MKNLLAKTILISSIISSLSACGRNNKLCLVTFNTNCDTQLEQIYVKRGSLLEEPEKLTKKAYEFKKWGVGVKEWNFATDRVTEDIVLRAFWTRVGYVINTTYTNNEYKNYAIPAYKDIQPLEQPVLLTVYDNFDDYKTVTGIDYKYSGGTCSSSDKYVTYDNADDLDVTLRCGLNDSVYKKYLNENGDLYLEQTEYREHPDKNGHDRIEYSYDANHKLIKKAAYEYGYFKYALTYDYFDNAVIEQKYSDINCNNRLYYYKTVYDSNGAKLQAHIQVDSFQSQTALYNYESLYNDDGSIKQETTYNVLNDAYHVIIHNYSYDSGVLVEDVKTRTIYNNSGQIVQTLVVKYGYDSDGHLTNEIESLNYEFVSNQVYYNYMNGQLYRKHEGGRSYIYPNYPSDPDYYSIYEFDDNLRRTVNKKVRTVRV